MRALSVIAVAAALALGVFASVASAAPLSMTFTEARANVGKQLDDAALFAPPDTAPFAAQIDPVSGAITEGSLQVPQFATFIETPIEADVTVDFEIGTITGSFSPGAHALTLKGHAGGILTSEGKECIVSIPETLTLSTAGNSGGTNPRFGAPFTAGLTGPGAIAGQWDAMTAEPVLPEFTSFCNNVEDYIGGPGGIWMEQKGDVVPPSAPQLTGTDPAAPGGLSGTPRILGSAEAGSTVRIYAGTGCAGTPVATGSAADLGSPGIGVTVAQGTATFSATATDTAGNTSACSVPISYTRFEGDPGARCIVPKLGGKTLARARTALQAAHCSVGKVQRPKHRKGRRTGPLVVKSSRPSAGTTLAAGSGVNLRLGPRPRKAHIS